jgi:hypothetical protein
MADDDQALGDDEAPLSDYKALFEDAIPNARLDLPISALPPESLSAINDTLLKYQSPVKSQGQRGVCSIFSSVALMEHLYIRAGLEEPDFSEQYLQWASKYLNNAFPTSSGSNDYQNLQTVWRWGIPAEHAWPYEFAQWGATQNPDCVALDEDDVLPTFCFTNGFPPAEAVAAGRYQLPAAQAINTSPTSIMNHIENTQTGVVVGLDFFYQAWNHSKSTLPRNMDYWYGGVVQYPNDEDIVASHEQQAGHAVLIVGWDQEIEFPTRDADGNFITDENGDYVTEQGFYIFKNSWGTAGFGIDNPNGPGYGYLSMAYVQQFGYARRAAVPALNIPPDPEPFDGHLFAIDTPVAIPDNDPSGASSTISIASPGRAQNVRVTVMISHPYRGNLQVRLTKGEDSVVLHDLTGGSADHVYLSTVLDDFAGAKRNGDWTLEMSDHAGFNTGALLFWYLEFES